MAQDDQKRLILMLVLDTDHLSELEVRSPAGRPLPPEEHAAFITTNCIEAPHL